MKVSIRIVVLGAVLVLLALVGCGGDDGDSDSGGNGGSSSESLVDKIKTDKKVTIGIKFDQPGLGLKNPDGTYSGFDVSVAEYVAGKLGVQPSGIKWVETPSASRETALQDKTVDMIFATYSITDERKEQVSFAGPYFIAQQDLLVKADNSDITGPESMDNKILCSVTGSTPAQKIKDEYAGKVQLKEYDGYSQCINALKTGAVDAVTTDDIILAGYAAQNPGEFKLVGKGFSEEKYGVGLWKDDTKTVDAVNKAIEEMESSGEWEKALKKAVGKADYELPTEPPAIEPAQ